MEGITTDSVTYLRHFELGWSMTPPHTHTLHQLLGRPPQACRHGFTLKFVSHHAGHVASAAAMTTTSSLRACCVTTFAATVHGRTASLTWLGAGCKNRRKRFKNASPAAPCFDASCATAYQHHVHEKQRGGDSKRRRQREMDNYCARGIHPPHYG